MVDYDTKLGEWFKQVEQKAQEIRARKTAAVTPGQAENDASAQVTEETGMPVATAGVATVEKVDEPIEAPRDLDERPLHMPALFDESETPPVEDFLSFLNRTEEKETKIQEPVVPDVDSDQKMLGLSEGTGEPRPIIPTRRQEPPAVAAAPPPSIQPEPMATVPAAATPTVTRETEAVEQTDLQASWARLPQQLQDLLESAQEEVAQHSYKAFKESRAGLIQRLLDPSMTLEEAARLLKVCPTTVRRYTNRGILKHFRTAGNQRRFRLSDVLSFMETQLGRNSADN